MKQLSYRRDNAELAIGLGTEQKRAAGFTSAHYVLANIKGDTIMDWIEYQLGRLMPDEVRNHNHSYKDMFWIFLDHGLFEEPGNGEFFHRVVAINKRRFRRLLRRVAIHCRIKGGGYKGKDVDCQIIDDNFIEPIDIQEDQLVITERQADLIERGELASPWVSLADKAPGS